MKEKVRKVAMECELANKWKKGSYTVTVTVTTPIWLVYVLVLVTYTGPYMQYYRAE